MSDTATPSSPEPVTFCEVVSALIRVAALKFGLYTLSFLVQTVANRASSASFKSFQPTLSLWFEPVVCLVLILGVYWLWQFAPFVARLITRGKNSVFPASSFGLHDLYSFAFVFVGLECVVETFGPSLTWLHYALTRGSSSARLTPEQQMDFYTLFKYLVKFIIGLALTFNARKLATKLLKRQQPANIQPAPPAAEA